MIDTIYNILTNNLKNTTFEERKKIYNYRQEIFKAGYKTVFNLKNEFHKLDFSNYKISDTYKKQINSLYSKWSYRPELQDWQYYVLYHFYCFGYAMEIDTNETELLSFSNLNETDPKLNQKAGYITDKLHTLSFNAVKHVDKIKGQFSGELEKYVCSREVSDGFIKVCKVYLGKVPDSMRDWEDWKMAIYYYTFINGLEIKWY